MAQGLVGDRYEILERIGRGGFSEVFLGLDARLNRYVAIKRLDLLLLGPKDRERFVREARMLARMKHRHIITIYSLEEEDDHLCLVMEYADQGNLHDRISASENGLPFADVIDIGIAICKALVAVHAEGIIHRDVKPANILLVTEVGEKQPIPKLSDFGVARDWGATPLTSESQTLGTLRYMPPEAILGREGQADARRDIYGLGATLYEALTKRLPMGDDLGEFLRHLDRSPVSPRSFRSDIPEWLEQVILRALAPDRDDRYPTASVMLSDLQRGKRVSEDTVPVSVKQKAGIQSLLARYRWYLVGLAGLILIILLLTVLLHWGGLLLATPTPTPTSSSTATWVAPVVTSPTHTPTIPFTPTATASPTSTFTPTLTPTPTRLPPPPPTDTPTPLPTDTPAPPPPPQPTSVPATPTPR